MSQNTIQDWKQERQAVEQEMDRLITCGHAAIRRGSENPPAPVCCFDRTAGRRRSKVLQHVSLSPAKTVATLRSMLRLWQMPPLPYRRTASHIAARRRWARAPLCRRTQYYSPICGEREWVQLCWIYDTARIGSTMREKSPDCIRSHAPRAHRTRRGFASHERKWRPRPQSIWRFLAADWPVSSCKQKPRTSGISRGEDAATCLFE